MTEAEAELARQRLPPVLVDALAEMEPEQSGVILGLRYMLGMTEEHSLFRGRA